NADLRSAIAWLLVVRKNGVDDVPGDEDRCRSGPVLRDRAALLHAGLEERFRGEPEPASILPDAVPADRPQRLCPAGWFGADDPPEVDLRELHEKVLPGDVHIHISSWSNHRPEGALQTDYASDP